MRALATTPFCRSIKDNIFSAYGMFLLAQMAQLQFLELKARVLFPFPLMPQLRHLTIKLYGHHDGQHWSLFEYAVDSIAALPALQTLYAEVLIRKNPCLQRPDLDLRACASLQAVYLVGVVPNEVLLPPGAKLTLDISVSDDSGVHRIMAHGLHLRGITKPQFLTNAVDFSMLSALSLHNVDDPGVDVVKISLGGYNASHLQFLSVTCWESKSLDLTLSLPHLSILEVHAADRLELGFDDVKTNAAWLDTVSMQWKVSNTLHNLVGKLRAHCRKEIYAGVLVDPSQPELLPRHFASTREIEGVGGTGE